METIATLTMNPAVDKSTEAERVVPERKLRCGRPDFDPGGGGINAARAILRLGGPVQAFFTRGGASGEQLARLLEAEGLACRTIPIRGRTRENFAVYDRSSTQQYRFGMPGPEVLESEWKQCLKTLTEIEPPPGFLILSGSLPPDVPEDFYARAAAAASERGIRCAVDCTGAPLRHALDQGVFLIKPNLKEFHDLIGRQIEGEALLARQARQLVRDGCCQAALISLGAAGGLLAWSEGTTFLRAPTVRVQSKIGAGDSTMGGMVLALARGETLVDAARFGIAAGAAAVMTPGSQLCRREDTERLYQAMKSELSEKQLP